MENKQVNKDAGSGSENIIELTGPEAEERINAVKKRITVTTIVFACLIALILTSQALLFIQNRKYTQMYEQQLSVNTQLEDLIETLGTDTAEAGEAMPLVSGENEPSEDSESEQETEPEPPQGTRGSDSEIPASIRKRMDGISMGSGSPVSFDELAYLTVPYYSFSGEIEIGHMIASKEVSEELLDIFEQLIERQYPIERMEIIEDFEEYQNDLFDTAEAAARGSNDTFAFCYRKTKKKFAANSYGKAVEINPRINPRVEEDGSTYPKNAVKYTDREIALEGTERWAFIGSDSEIVQIFEEHGWTWGGEKDGRDYGHFEKTK